MDVMLRVLDRALDLLLWPFREMHDAAVAGYPDASMGEVWLVTWFAGSVLLIVIWALVAFVWNQLCMTLFLATRQLHQRADEGAPLETRRGNARRALLAEHLILRMRRWSRVTMWPVPDRDHARLTPTTVGAVGARAILCVPAALAGLATAAKNVLTRPVGLATLAAATWVTNEPALRRLLADLQAGMSSATGMAVPLYALTFAVITFTLTNAVHGRRRGLGKWRTGHAAAAYETLSEVRAHATTMAETLDLEVWHDIAVVLDYHVEHVLADELDELLDDRLDQFDAEHDRPPNESRLRRRGDREYRRMTLDLPRGTQVSRSGRRCRSSMKSWPRRCLRSKRSPESRQ